MKAFVASTFVICVLLVAAAPDTVLATLSGAARWVYETNVVQFFDATAWRAICFP